MPVRRLRILAQIRSLPPIHHHIFAGLPRQQLGYHTKPVGLLNACGFYDPLIAFFDHAVQEGFIRPASRSIAIVGNTPAELLDKLAAHKAPESVISLALKGELQHDGPRG